MAYYLRYLNVYRGEKKERFTLGVIYDSILGDSNIDRYISNLPSDLLSRIEFDKTPPMYDLNGFITSTLPAGSDYYMFNPDTADESEARYRVRIFNITDIGLPGELYLSNADGKYSRFQGGNARNLYTPDGNHIGQTPWMDRYWDPASESTRTDWGSTWDITTEWANYGSAYLIVHEISSENTRKYQVISIKQRSSGSWFTNLYLSSFTSTGAYKWEDSDNAPFYPIEDSPYGDDQSGPAGGGGTHDDGLSDNIAGDIPNGTVEANSSSVGLFTRYAMNVGQMKALADKIYADDFLEKLGLEVTKFLWNSPIDAIISCQSYPFAVTSLVGSSAVNDIKLGAVPTGLSGSALAGSAAKIDWGSIRLEEYWKNFLDYAPHTKIELYLPWSTGFVEIDPHECLPGSIGVVTNIEFGKGTCQHIVTGNKGAVIGIFSGVCATTLPLTSIDTASKAINVVTAAAGLAVAAATGGAATSAGIAAGIAKGSGAALTAKEFASHVAGTKAAISAAERPYKAVQGASLKVAAQSSVAAFRQPPHVVRNGSFNGNGAGMGIQYPFIILSRPTQNVPKNYGHYYGYPSNIYTTLGSVSGYTEVASVHLDGISCTGQEREEIDNLLKGGVIL